MDVDCKGHGEWVHETWAQRSNSLEKEGPFMEYEKVITARCSLARPWTSLKLRAEREVTNSLAIS